MASRRKRTDDYVGPKRAVSREDLAKLEATGDYVIDEKLDGEWCRVQLDDGCIVALNSRTGIALDGGKALGLIALQTAIRAPAILVGELVADTTRSGRKSGQRRLHLFDVIDFNGTDCRDMRTDDRRSFLVCIQAAMGKADRIKLAEQRESGFQAFFDEIIARGGEGVVVKRKRSKYRAPNADGKINGWMRCKPMRTVDYVVRDTGKAKGGTPNLSLGLIKGLRGPSYGLAPSVTHVMNATIPKHMRDIDPKTLIGRVVEVEGYEVFPSGAVRHGQITRVRDDKVIEDCTFNAARHSDPALAAIDAYVHMFLDDCSGPQQ